MHLIISLFIILSAVPAFAKNYGSAGCGLGSMVIENDNTWWKQVIASGLNGTGSQSIAITVGTFNCDSPTPGKMAQIESYVEANKLALANDIAKGNGETITGLSAVYGCENSAAFGMTLKNNYKTIYPSYDADTTTVANNINKIATNVCNTSL
jgi:hypothetical protein